MQNTPKQLTPGAFPARLKEIPDPPKTLFVRGDLPSDERPWLAVVGSRKYTPYGKQAVETLLGGLKGSDVVIVSGLALGTDALAHRAALENNLTTVAVPGSGLNDSILYPRTNLALARAILESGGALLSEYEPAQPAARWTFPKRNRIMVGLADAVLLIEASERSGTLITARLAGEYSRDLLGVPGSIFSENSKGVHQFLKLGATPVTSASDLMQALNISSDEQLVLPDFDEQELLVLSALETPLARDKLIHALGMSTTDANILLSTMELKGVLTEELGVVRKTF